MTFFLLFKILIIIKFLEWWHWQHAYQSFLCHFLVLSRSQYCNTWVNFETFLHEPELQLSDYNTGKYFCSNVHISGRMFFFFICFANNFFMVKIEIVITGKTYIWVKYFPIL